MVIISIISPKPFLVSAWKAGIFDGPQICKMMLDQVLTARMTVAERAAWCSYVSVLRELLGNTKLATIGTLWR